MVQEEIVTTKPGICKIKIKVREAKRPEDGYDPIQEAIDRKNCFKPPDDLNNKKAKYLFLKVLIP